MTAIAQPDLVGRFAVARVFDFLIGELPAVRAALMGEPPGKRL